MILFIIKSTITLTLLYCCVFVLLRNNSFHRFNRMTLLCIILAAFVVPMVHVSTNHPTVINEGMRQMEDNSVNAVITSPPYNFGLRIHSGKYTKWTKGETFGYTGLPANRYDNRVNDAMSMDDYFKKLVQLCKIHLSKAKAQDDLNADVFPNNTGHYDLGDRVSVVNRYGIIGSATVTEITETEDASGYRTIPTLGKWSVEKK